jgi:4-hydroxy-tetrahydrodipicolinate synthase
MNKVFKGLYTALITPFLDGQVDYDSLKQLLVQQAAVDGFVVHGTTAESPNLTDEERKKIFEFIKAQTNKKIIVGTGTNSTAETIRLTKQAEAWGADAALVVVPYYNKPPQRGLVAHFQSVAEGAKIPIILYNVPGRTVTELKIETIIQLSHHKNIVGIKEASGNIALAREIIKNVDKDFVVLSGDDLTYVDFLKAGGDGAISVASHVLPRQMSLWTKSPQAETNTQEHQKYFALMELLFKEANPIPVKKVMQLMNIISSAELRLPLVECEQEITTALNKELQKLGLIA